jgi:hypothetical protein
MKGDAIKDSTVNRVFLSEWSGVENFSPDRTWRKVGRSEEGLTASDSQVIHQPGEEIF